LSRSGNRQLNAALHRIAITQIRCPGPGQTYYRKKTERKTKRGWRASNLPDCGPNRVRFGKDSRNWQGNTRNTSPSFVTR
jgi:hypothetical protein